MPEWVLWSDMENAHASLKRLFQHEFARMVAVISRLFGLQHIEMAEDIVSETFLLATERWAIKGIPENPTAWLYAVAKQKTLYQYRRNNIFEKKVMPAYASAQEESCGITAFDFSLQNIRDSQLQMIFAVCTPAIASEAQIGLALRILCGFGIDEIAEAFLSNKDTINKRLYRAKEKLRSEKVQLALPPENELAGRLDNVLHIIYLLFSEGYYSRTRHEILRKDLCLEALRLGILLTEYDITNRPKTNALIALMCFHASRFSARKTGEDVLVLYEQQNEALWDVALINQGSRFLHRSAQGEEISSYHIEAKIASLHCIKADTREKWEEILQLYNQLLQVNYSPVVALNRTFALYKANGRQASLTEAGKLKLENNHFYFVLLGELYKDVDNEKALQNFQLAHALAKTQTEKQLIRAKMDTLT